MNTSQNGPEPAGENTVNSFIMVDGASAMIDFLTDVFGATETLEARSPDMFAADGSLIHAEVRIGSSLIMLADRKADWPFTPDRKSVGQGKSAECGGDWMLQLMVT